MRVVVCAALRSSGLIICSPRHFDPISRAALKAAGHSHIGCEQGFVDQYGVFMSREEARVVAVAANQIVRRCGGDEKRLYSENLY